MTTMTASTAPPQSMHDRSMRRERIDRTILRAIGERRVLRTLRTNGTSSVWDRLEALVVHASTALWEERPTPCPLSEDLAAFCAFMARELEINERLDLPAAKDLAHLRRLVPRALDALDSVTAPLVLGDSDPSTRVLSATFGAIRAELLSAAGSGLWKQAA